MIPIWITHCKYFLVLLQNGFYLFDKLFCNWFRNNEENQKKDKSILSKKGLTNIRKSDVSVVSERLNKIFYKILIKNSFPSSLT